MVLPFPEKEPSVSSYIPLSPVLLPTPEEPGASDRSAFCELFRFYQMVFGVAHSAKNDIFSGPVTYLLLSF